MDLRRLYRRPDLSESIPGGSGTGSGSVIGQLTNLGELILRGINAAAVMEYCAPEGIGAYRHCRQVLQLNRPRQYRLSPGAAAGSEGGRRGLLTTVSRDPYRTDIPIRVRRHD